MALIATALAGCAEEDQCDFIDVEESVKVEWLGTKHVTFSIGDLPSDIRYQPTLLLTAYGKPGGLEYWVAPFPFRETRCYSGTTSRSADRFCSRFLHVIANSSDGFMLKGESSGQYEIELALIDMPKDSKLQEEPLCTRTVHVEIPR